MALGSSASCGAQGPDPPLRQSPELPPATQLGLLLAARARRPRGRRRRRGRLRPPPAEVKVLSSPPGRCGPPGPDPSSGDRRSRRREAALFCCWGLVRSVPASRRSADYLGGIPLLEGGARMPVGLPRCRRWVPDVSASDFFKWFLGTIRRTPGGHAWNSGSGATSRWGKRPDLKDSLHLASRHPLIAGAHQ